jgi:hypothetical protein
MAVMGHSSSALALEVYAKTMSRERETGARMDSLGALKRHKLAQMAIQASPTFSAAATETA